MGGMRGGARPKRSNSRRAAQMGRGATSRDNRGVVLAWPGPRALTARMDVRCNRCGTDYEFDDDLISDRGTTVQCTNCGYQFKIYPERTQVMSPERWVVRTMGGREMVYTSLRDLQKAIGEHKVGPKDLLSRGNQSPRALGSIPELEP